MVVRADAEELHAPGVDELREGVGHPVALELPFVAVAGGKREQGRTQCPKTATPMSWPSRGECQ